MTGSCLSRAEPPWLALGFVPVGPFAQDADISEKLFLKRERALPPPLLPGGLQTWNHCCKPLQNQDLHPRPLIRWRVTTLRWIKARGGLPFLERLKTEHIKSHRAEAMLLGAGKSWPNAPGNPQT